ncbi:MAG: peptidase S1, partial [Caldanaerobacter sp.]
MQHNFNRILAIAIISSFITSLVFVYVAPNFLWGKIIPIPYPPESSLKKEIIIPKKETPTVAEAVAKKAMPAVVGITTLEFERK